MKKFSLSLIGFFWVTSFLLAQSESISEIKFYYDNAGNRIERQIVYYEASQKSASITTDEEDLEFDKVLNVYPNPAHECLYVTLNQEAIDSDNKEILIFDIAGRLLRRESAVDETCRIDISTFTNGTYFLKLTFGNKHKEWTIIKN